MRAQRRNIGHEAYFTLRMLLAGGTEYWAMAHDNMPAAIVAVVAAIYWCVKANDEACKP